MRFLLILPILTACASPPSPDVGCAGYGEHRGKFADEDFLAAPDGLQVYLLALDEAMTAGCR